MGGQVPRSYRQTCPARLAALLDSRNSWVSNRVAGMAEEDHMSLQQKLDRDFAMSTSWLKEVVKSTRKREKQLRIKYLRHARVGKRGGRHKVGESKLEAMA